MSFDKVGKVFGTFCLIYLAVDFSDYVCKEYLHTNGIFAVMSDYLKREQRSALLSTDKIKEKVIKNEIKKKIPFLRKKKRKINPSDRIIRTKSDKFNINFVHIFKGDVVKPKRTETLKRSDGSMIIIHIYE